MFRGHTEVPQLIEGGAGIQTRAPPSGHLQQRQPGKALPLTQSLLLPKGLALVSLLHSLSAGPCPGFSGKSLSRHKTLPACQPAFPQRHLVPPGNHSGLSLSGGGPVATSGKPTDLETAGWELKRERGQSQDSERDLSPELS